MRRAGDLHGATLGISALAVYARLGGDNALSLEQHLEALEMARQLGDPEMTGLELLNVVIPLVKLGRWREAIDPWIEGLTLVRDAGIEWEQVAALTIAISPLFAAGDVEGAAETWAAATALATERNLRIQPADIDSEAVAAIEGAELEYVVRQPRDGARLEEALELAKRQLEGLRASGS